MAKFDLSSVYGSGTEYSILKMLKEFIDIIESSDFSTTAETNTKLANLKTELETEISDLENTVDNTGLFDVVELSGTSGTLSESDYSKITKEHTIIKHTTTGGSPIYYRHWTTTSSTIVFKPLRDPHVSSNGESVYFYDDQITITISGRVWLYTNNIMSGTSTYNQSKINSLINSAVSGRLPVYNVESDTDMDTLIYKINTPCILYDTANDDTYLVTYIELGLRNKLDAFLFSPSNNNISIINIISDEGDIWVNCDINTIYTFTEYVDLTIRGDITLTNGVKIFGTFPSTLSLESENLYNCLVSAKYEIPAVFTTNSSVFYSGFIYCDNMSPLLYKYSNSSLMQILSMNDIDSFTIYQNNTLYEV